MSNKFHMCDIWSRNKAKLQAECKTSDKKFCLKGASFVQGILWLVKMLIMAVVMYGVGLMVSVMLIPRIMADYYNAVFSGIAMSSISMPVLIGEWLVPASFFVGLLLFATCSVFVMFWKWLSKFMGDILERIVNKTKSDPLKGNATSEQ